MSEVKKILNTINEDVRKSSEELLPIVYGELKKLAQLEIRKESPGQTLSATALVHEAFLRLVGSEKDAPNWDSIGHFYAAAATAMRRILIDIARKKRAEKHGGRFRRVALDTVTQSCDIQSDDWAGSLLELQSALDQFSVEFPKMAKLVELRYFGGLSMVEISKVTGQSLRSTHRNWAFARAWLFKKVNED